MINIVILDGHTLNPGDLDWSMLEQFGKVTVYDHSAPEEVFLRSIQAEILVINKVVLGKELINMLPLLKHVALTATGYNNLDLPALQEKGISVSNIRNYGSDTVAQHTFALILELCNHVALNADAVTGGKWGKVRDFCFWEQPIIELSGKILGVVGWGHIGQRVGRIGKAFGMEVITSTSRDIDSHIARKTDLEALFLKADIVTLHTHLHQGNEKFVNTAILSTMKSGALLINTSRGALIDEQALREALEQKKIAGAGLDVLSTEPPLKGNILIGAPNCIITPHNAWASFEARLRMMEILKENIAAFIVGNPTNLVN